MALDNLITNNSYPIVFIGSGIPKRYMKDSPSWLELLGEFWYLAKLDGDFYGKFNQLRSEEAKKLDINDSEIKNNTAEFHANAKIATLIEDNFNKAFNTGEIKLENFSTKDAAETNISPFKKAISIRFSSYELKEEMSEELELWYKFLHKNKITITTNYDNFIENSFKEISNDSLKTYIGQEGFFDNTIGLSELYKIHGCCTNPNSIIITDTDYSQFENKYILLTAKILSSLIDSPIIFLGYSMTDINVRNIIKNFTSQLPHTDSRISEDRIIVVERLEDMNELKIETIRDSEIGNYTAIKTDNFSSIYEKLLQINQGLTPNEIRKYENAFRKIIQTHGKSGTLDSFLVSPIELENLEDIIDSDRPIVVAFGDKKHIFVMPNFMSYMDDYINEENNIDISVALTFISNENINSRIPFARYLNQNLNLRELDIDEITLNKLSNKVNNFMQSFDTIIDNLDSTNKNNTYTQVNEIWNSENLRRPQQIERIIYNLENFDKHDIESFLKGELFTFFKEIYPDKNNTLKTHIRKLYYAYDIYINGDLREIII